VGWGDLTPVVGKRFRARPRKKEQVSKLATLLDIEPLRDLMVVIYGKMKTLRVVWREMWLRDVSHDVRGVVIATKHEPILLVSTDITLLPVVIIQLYAAIFPQVDCVWFFRAAWRCSSAASMDWT
jgi:hypothetical protein